MAADFTSWQTEELEYLKGLTREPEGDVLVMSYVEALKDLEGAECVQPCESSFISLTIP
jgi:hypothetical protein